jgi:polar amino acid transport system substrate-binding protein
MSRVSPTSSAGVASAGNGPVHASASSLLAPTGTLRIGLNASNTTLVARNPDGSVGGLAVAVGEHIAGKLAVPLEVIVYSGSEAYAESFGNNEWDIIVTGRNPFAITKVAMGPDIILTEYVFVARPGFDIAAASDVDRPGVRVGVPRNASADAFLRDRLVSAGLVRTDGTPATALSMLREGKIDVYGTIASSVGAIGEQLPGARLVPGVFNTVGFAVAMPKDRAPDALTSLTAIVAEAKRTGVIQRIITETGARGAVVAPD